MRKSVEFRWQSQLFIFSVEIFSREDKFSIKEIKIMSPLICEQMPAHCTHMLIVKSFGENVSVSV